MQSRNLFTRVIPVPNDHIPSDSLSTKSAPLKKLPKPKTVGESSGIHLLPHIYSDGHDYIARTSVTYDNNSKQQLVVTETNLRPSPGYERYGNYEDAATIETHTTNGNTTTSSLRITSGTLAFKEGNHPTIVIDDPKMAKALRAFLKDDLFDDARANQKEMQQTLEVRNLVVEAMADKKIDKGERIEINTKIRTARNAKKSAGRE